jgi:hypothetical protein
VNGYSDKMFSPPLDPPWGCIDWQNNVDTSGCDPSSSNRLDLYLTLLDKNVDHNEWANLLFGNLGRFQQGSGADLVLGATDKSFASRTQLIKQRSEGIFTHTMVIKELGIDLEGCRFYRDRHYSVRDTFVEFEIRDADTTSLHQSSIYFRASKTGLVREPTEQLELEGENWDESQLPSTTQTSEQQLQTQLDGEARLLLMQAEAAAARKKASSQSRGSCEQCMIRYRVPTTAAYSQVAIQFQLSATVAIWGEACAIGLAHLPCRMLRSAQRKLVRLLCCRTKQQSKFLLNDGVDRISHSIDSFLLSRTKEVKVRHPKYDSSMQRMEFESSALELFPSRQFYHSLVLFLGTHGQGEELLAQVQNTTEQHSTAQHSAHIPYR